MNSLPKSPGRFLKKTARFCFNPLLAFLYPGFCLLCNRCSDENSFLCSDCQSRLDKAFLSNTNRPLAIANPYFDASVAALKFTKTVQTLIHYFKYAGYSQLSQVFSIYMCRRLEQKDITFDALQPVPLHPGRQRERGFNQAKYLCKHLSARFNVPVLDCLKRKRYTTQQAKHEQEERFKNVKNAFHLKNELSPGHILLVDDVLTTGATANECSRILRCAGARHITVLTIC